MGFDPTGSVDLGSAYGSINVDLSNVERQFNQRIGQLESGLGASFERIGAGFQRVGSQMTLAFAPITAFVGQGILAFANFDDVLTEIEARTGATADQMARVRDVALEMGQATLFTATDAADALLQLMSSGQSLEDAIATLPQVLALATVGSLQLGQAADGLTDIMAAFQLNVGLLSPELQELADQYGLSEQALKDWAAGLTANTPGVETFAQKMGMTTGELYDYITALKDGNDPHARWYEDLDELSTEIGVSATELVAWTTGIDNSSDSIQQLAKDMGMSTGELIDWIGATEDASTVVDTLSAAAGASSATVQMMVDAFSKVGPYAHGFGLSVNETAAALAVLHENGIKGVDAGEKLKTMFQQMTRGTEESEGAWARLNTSMFDAQGNMRDFDEVLDSINFGLEGMSTEERMDVLTDLAGAQGVIGLQALLAAGGIDTMVASMDAQQSAADIAKKKMTSFKGSIDNIKSSIETLSINVLGPLVEQYLQPLIDKGTAIINKINEWVVANPRLAGTIGLILMALSVLGPVLFAVGTYISFMGTVIGMLGGAIAFLLSPIGLLIAAAALLGYAFSTNFLGIRDFVEGIINAVVPFLQFTYALIRMHGVVDGLRAAFASLWGQGFLSNIFEALGFGEERAARIAQSIGRLVGNVLDVGEAFSRWFNAMRAFADIVGWGKVLQDTFNPDTLIGHAFQDLLNEFAELHSQIIDAIISLGAAMLKAFGKLMKPVLAWVGKQAKELGEEFLNKWLPKFVEWVAEVIPQLLLALAELGISLVSWIMGMLPQLLATLLEWGAAFLGWIGPIIEEILPQLGTLLGSMVGWIIGTGLPLLVGALLYLGYELTRWIIDAIPQVIPAMMQLNLAILNFIANDLIPGVRGFLVNFFTAMFGEVLNSIASINWGDVASKVWNGIKAGFNALVGAADDLLAWVDTNISQKILDAIDNLEWGDVPTKIWQAIKDVMSLPLGAVDNFLTWVDENISAKILEAIDTTDWSALPGQIYEKIKTALITAVYVLWDAATWVQSNVVTPIISGVLNRDWTADARTIYGKLKDALITAVYVLWDAANWLFTNVITPIFDAIQNFEFASTANAIYGALKSAMGGAVDALWEAATWLDANIVQPILTAVGNVSFSAIGTAIIEALKSAINGAWEGFVSFFTEKIGSLEVGGVSLSDVGNFLDPRAKGGPVKQGSPYVVGERGPEFFVPNADGQILPNEYLRQTMREIGWMAEMLTDAASLASSIGSNRQAAGAMGPGGGGGGNQTITVGPISMSLVPPAGVDASEYGKQVADSFGERLKTRIRQTTGFAG